MPRGAIESGLPMFKRLRQLEISLAAKCQILFGAAVVMIISAALFVPWQRMEQLTGLLNERAAAMVAQTVVAEHVILQRSRLNGAGTMRPALIQEMPATTQAVSADGTTQPALAQETPS